MITLHDAVYAAYPTAVTIYGDDADTLTVLDKDGETVAVNPATVTAKLADLQEKEASADQTAAAAKASALAKLAALGLTADEISALGAK